jgi:hypothetical protein
MSQEMLHLVFVIVAGLLVFVFIGIRRYWEARLNITEEEEDMERRVASLNEQQANRRRDDEIVRLLRGDEQPVVGDRHNRKR